MSEKLLVPDIGDFENVEVIEILVKPGDQIKENDPIVTIESDKSSVEIPSTIAGKVDSLAVKVGDKVSKGDLLLNLTSSSKTSSESTLPKDTENIIKQAEEAMAEKKKEEKIEVTESKHNYFGLAAKGFAINIFNVGVLIFWGGVTIVAGPTTGNDPAGFFVFFSIVLLSYFVTDLGKIVVSKQLKVFINEKTMVFVKSLLAIILVVSGTVIIVGATQTA